MKLLRPSIGHVTEVTTTDDPSDPCAYCVHWEESPDDFMGDRAMPYTLPGVPATRLYRYVHADCEAAVSHYIAESHQ